MPLFHTPRERRLWLTTAAVLLAIYSTLGVVRPITEALRDRGWLFPSLALLGLTLLAVLGRFVLKSRPGRWEITVGVGILLAYGLLILWMRTPEEVMHLVQYGAVGGLTFNAFRERGTRHAAVLAVVFTTAAGWVDEGIQYLLPERYYDLRDVAFNGLAGLLAVAALSLRGWARRRDGTD